MIGITIALLAIYFALLFIGFKLSDIANTLKDIKKSNIKNNNQDNPGERR